MSMSHEDEIVKQYGDISLESAPVDPDKPTFNSLLGALKAVHTGEMEIEVLEKYHEGLSVQLENSIRNIDKIEAPEEYREKTEEQVNLAKGALSMVQMMLDHLEDYIENPCMENMAPCVQLLLDCQGAIGGLNEMLDENIRQGLIAEQELKKID